MKVRHARDASIALPKDSSIFRLKKNYKNLESSVYAENLKAYLLKLTCHVNMDMKDFSDAVQSLS